MKSFPMTKQSFVTFLNKRSPEIFLSLGIAGAVTTTIFAIKATIKAVKVVEEIKEEKRVSSEEEVELTKAEIVKSTWTLYLPTAFTGAISIACLINANSINRRRNAALAAAFSLSKTALEEYQGKVVEKIGKKKEKDIKDSIAKDKLDAHPATNNILHTKDESVSNNVVYTTNNKNTLCYDCLIDRLFYSDMETIRSAVNELNKNLIEDMYVSLNDFYYLLGLKEVKLGEELGWNIDDGIVKIDYSSILTEDGKPCLAINYRIAPRYEFGR